MLAAGDLNRRVTIERYLDVANEAGGFTRHWSKLRDAWVKATPVGGKEAIVAGTLQARQPWRIEMRRGSIRTEDRVRMGAALLQILSIADPDGRGEALLLFCETGFD